MSQPLEAHDNSLVTREEPEQEVASFAVIRTETVLSKFPVHSLSKQGKITIAISKKGPDGISQIAWKVSPNQEFGEPGQLAYKLDTLLINRKIEEAGRPLPTYIRLGSLHEIAKILGAGSNKVGIKNALLQNASVFITAKFAYNGADGAKHTLEAGFTRYSVIFTGETLPDGMKADAVYIIPTDIYREVLNQAQVRPLNYDYLKALTPSAQRFYEILSYRIFAAFQQKSPHAAITYSEYCTLAPQIRSLDWNCVRAQMYKVHKPHLDAKYLARVEFRPQPDDDGQPDWLMLYTAGPKAKSEYARFTRRKSATDLSPAHPVKSLAPPKNVTPKPTPAPAPPKPAASRQAAVTPASRSRRRRIAVAVPESPTPLLEALTQRGISARGAAQLLAGLQPGQAAQLPTQLEYADYLVATSVPPLRNPAGFLVALVRDNLIVPHDFAGTERQAQEAQASALREQAAETQADLEYQYEIYKEQAVAEYLAALPPAERQHLYEADKAAFLAQHPGARRWAEAVLQTTLAALRQGQLQSSLPLLEFDAFREQLWPSRRAAWEAAAR